MPSTSLTRLTRRTSLLALGAAGLVAAPQIPAANAKGKKKGDVNKRCKKQVAPCKSTITSQCVGNAQCIASTPGCCEILKTCAFSEFVTCLNASLAANN